MVSGVGVTLLRLVNALQKRGHLLRIYTANYALPDGIADRPEVHRSSSVPFFLYPDIQWAFPRARDIEDDLAAFQPDVVHVATEFAMGLAGLKAADRLGIPVISSAHTDYQKYAYRYGVPWVLDIGWIYGRWFYNRTAKVLCPSRLYEEYLHTRGIHHTGVWSRGVDPEEFSPAFRSEDYRRSFGVGPDDILVTYIGRLAKEKDLGRLLDAWKSLGKSKGRAQLVLVGKGPMGDELERHPIPGVHLAGLRHARALGEAYASADLFVFPSCTETFGNSLLEAMGSGLPSLAVADGGVMEFARTGENALLVKSRDTAALLTGLQRLLQDAELRSRLARGGLQTAEERAWGPIYDQLLADYQWVAEMRRTRAA
jgi:glycosyltransferase involved in cell wall biosynthesis